MNELVVELSAGQWSRNSQWLRRIYVSSLETHLIKLFQLPFSHYLLSFRSHRPAERVTVDGKLYGEKQIKSPPKRTRGRKQERMGKLHSSSAATNNNTPSSTFRLKHSNHTTNKFHSHSASSSAVSAANVLLHLDWLRNHRLSTRASDQYCNAMRYICTPRMDGQHSDSQPFVLFLNFHASINVHIRISLSFAPAAVFW